MQKVDITFLLSYDSVVPLSDVGGVSPEAAPARLKQWWVSSRWLTDSGRFNEWMCEEDYELTIVVSEGALSHGPRHLPTVVPFIPGRAFTADSPLPWSD